MLTAFGVSGPGCWRKERHGHSVSKAPARMRKCGFCNGAGHFYPIDEGPLQECQICNGSGLVRVKVLRKRPEGRGSPRGAKVDRSTDASFGRVRVRQNE
jgi:DnaJ-class molecular chaperone